MNKEFCISWKSHVPFLSYAIYYILNLSINFETRPANRYRHGQYFQEIFCMIWSTGSQIQVLFNLLNDSFLLLWRCALRRPKIVHQKNIIYKKLLGQITLLFY